MVYLLQIMIKHLLENWEEYRNKLTQLLYSIITISKLVFNSLRNCNLLYIHLLYIAWRTGRGRYQLLTVDNIGGTRTTIHPFVSCLLYQSAMDTNLFNDMMTYSLLAVARATCISYLGSIPVSSQIKKL